MNEDEKKIKKAEQILAKLNRVYESPVVPATYLIFLGKCVEAALIKALESRSECVRHTAIIALGGLKSKKAIRPIAALFFSEASELVENSIAFSLKELGAPAVRHVSSLLDGKEPMKVSESIRLIGEMGAVSVMPKLLVHLKSNDYRIWSASAEALVKMGCYVQACMHVRQMMKGGDDRLFWANRLVKLGSIAKNRPAISRPEKTLSLDYDKLRLKRFPRAPSPVFAQPCSHSQEKAQKPSRLMLQK